MACSRSFGCSHYQRKCKLVAPCCEKIYPCRLCHDEQETHAVDRKKVKEVVCAICHRRQRAQRECDNCEVRFGQYFCPECNLFDDENKGQYHCEGCGICRVGGADNYFHCPVCNMCLNVRLFGAHRCVENRSRTDCPVCVEDLHSSRNELHMPRCGHILHKLCFDKLQTANHLHCPICKRAFGN